MLSIGLRDFFPAHGLLSACTLAVFFFFFFKKCFLCICAPVLYHLFVKAAVIDRYSCLSGSLPLFVCFECLFYIVCVLRRVNTVSQSVISTRLQSCGQWRQRAGGRCPRDVSSCYRVTTGCCARRKRSSSWARYRATDRRRRVADRDTWTADCHRRLALAPAAGSTTSITSSLDDNDDVADDGNNNQWPTYISTYLQCFDKVAWEWGRASGL